MATEIRWVLHQYSNFMDTKNIKIVTTVFITAVVFINARCNKTPLDCADTKYSFQLSIKAYPDKDTINIGDTVWLEINESTSFQNGQSGQTVDYSGAENLGSVLSFGNYDTTLRSWVNENPNSFDLDLFSGYGKLVNQTAIDLEYLFSERENRYRFLLGVVPKKKGLFSLLFSNSGNTYRRSDKCTKANFIINFKNTNQHYYLSPSYNGQTDLVGGDYYFVVK